MFLLPRSSGSFPLRKISKPNSRRACAKPLLPGRVLALLFEKQSLRTRVSFEAGMAHLGGSSLMLGDDAGFGKRESVADFARVLSEMVDVVVIRSKRHATVVEFAQHCIVRRDQWAHGSRASVPGARRSCIPCKNNAASLDGLHLAWVGDGNNVARSLVEGCGHLGVRLSVCTPPGYELDVAFLKQAKRDFPNLELTTTHDPRGRGARCRGGVHRCVGQHGAGKRAATSENATSPTTR